MRLSYIKNLLSYLYDKQQSTFTVVRHEPLGGGDKHTKFKIIPNAPLHSYLENWRGYTAKIGERMLSDYQAVGYVPSVGDIIDLFPEVGVKSFTNSYIERLNETAGNGGRFLKSVIVTESVQPLIKRYFVDNERPVLFDGQEYTPLSMIWSGFELSSSMALTTMTVTIPNVGGQVIAYIETIDILENDVVLQVLHTDLLDDVTAVDKLILQIQMIQADDISASFTLGLNLGLGDMIPREVITKAEFPGLVDDVVRLRV